MLMNLSVGKHRDQIKSLVKLCMDHTFAIVFIFPKAFWTDIIFILKNSYIF